MTIRMRVLLLIVITIPTLYLAFSGPGDAALGG